jgi:predicted methyltransferase
MDMQVGHGFTGIVAMIDHQAEAGIAGTDAQLPGHLTGGD